MDLYQITIFFAVDYRELKKTTMATAAVTSLSKSMGPLSTLAKGLMCVVIFGTLLCRPLQNNNVK